MSDFMNNSVYRPLTIENLKAENGAIKSALDDARAESDKLRGMLAGWNAGQERVRETMKVLDQHAEAARAANEALKAELAEARDDLASARETIVRLRGSRDSGRIFEDAIKGLCDQTRAERDDARLEAERLEAELTRIVKERDDAASLAARFQTDLNTANAQRNAFKERSEETAKFARQMEYMRDAACEEIRKLQEEAAESAASAKLEECTTDRPCLDCRHKAELARVAKERDDAKEALRDMARSAESWKAEAVRHRELRKAAAESATPLKPGIDAETILHGIASIARTLDSERGVGAPGDAEFRLTRIALVVGKMLAATRGGS